MPRRFLIVSDSRSGTSLLSETLNAHPDIVCHGELFHRWPEWHLKGTLEDWDVERAVAAREADADGFLEQAFDQPGAAAVGFKMWRSHAPERCDRMLADETWPKIVVERRNVLARYASSRLVKATGVHNMLPHERRVPWLDRTIPWDETDFRTYLRAHRKLFRFYRETARGPVLRVTYEDLVRDGFGAVLDFLGVERRDLVPQKQKLHSSDILARFDEASRPALEAFLVEMKREHWARE